MADVSSRSTASRGRGSGRAGRGGLSSRGGRSAPTSSTKEQGSTVTLEQQGEIGQLKRDHATELTTLRELFPDWTDDDFVLALQEADGDLSRTIERISEGNVSQFLDVKKKTKEKPKAKKEAPADSTATRRGRGGSEVRGRGRAAERGERGERGRTRGGRGGSAAPNGTKAAPTSVPTVEVGAWGTTGNESWDQPATSNTEAGSKPTTTVPSVPSTEPAKTSSIIPEGSKKSWASMLSTPKPQPVMPKPRAEPPQVDPGFIEQESIPQPETTLETLAHEAELSPPRDRLTEDNVEHLPDVSVPVATETVASTLDANSVIGTGTPLESANARPPLGGYATTAWKATGTPARSASFQRRMLEQREAVVMPGNHAVDRTAVQFGSLGLNGEQTVDIDEDREEAQTRTPAAQSPPSQPRTSLPVSQQASESQSAATPKQAPGLPTAPGQYGRYGNLGQEASTHKPYDAFSQQLNYAPGQDGFPAQASNTSSQAYGQGDFPPGYGSDQRNAYSNYYGSYGQAQEPGQGPPRTGSGFAGDNFSNAHGAQSRFSEGQNSGHTTPNPTASQSGQSGQSGQSQMHPGQSQAQGHGYPYNQSYYGNQYYGGSYMNQYPNNYFNQQGYGGPYNGKSNMYGQPHHYGISPQASYDQSASPAAGYGRGNDSSLSSDYGRSGSTQPQGSNNGSYTHSSENYNRGYGMQNQHHGAQQTEELKGFGNDTKTGAGASGGQPGRTGSAANNSNYSSNQSSYQQSQQSQQYANYPSHMGQQHSSHGSGYGNLGGHQGNNHNQQSQYGSYGGFNNSYNYGRGGWGGNYGH